MAESTQSAMPIDVWTDTEMDRAPAQLPIVNYECELVLAKDMDITGGSPTAGDLGGTFKVHGYTSFTTNDAVATILNIPRWVDRTQEIKFQVVFNSETASKDPTWEITYEPIELGTDYDIAIDTALDTTIPANTDGAAGDTETIRETYVGAIDGNTISRDAEYLAIQAKMTANDSATNWVLFGVKVFWPKAAI